VPIIYPPNKDPLEGRVSFTIEDCKGIQPKPSIPQNIPKRVPGEVPKEIPKEAPEVKSDASVVIDNIVSLDGIDISPTDFFTIYLDSMRFIPENCGLVKVTLSGLNSTHANTITASNMTPNQNIFYPRISSTISMPLYYQKRAIKVGNIDPNTILVGMMETYDLMNKKFKILGYFAINLFVDRSTEHNSMKERLNEENFQLPIYCELPIPKPLTMKQL